ncbi:MAG: apolipoprotein N-acyltransferase [Pseudomonadota bacterium]
MTEKIEQFEGWLILLSGWHRHFGALFAGALTALAMPPFDLFFLPAFTFPVLIWLMDGAASEPDNGLLTKLGHGFLPGFFFGFGYFLAGLWWIGNALLVEAESFAWAWPLAVIALPAVLAIFWGIATALSRLFWNGELRRLFILAAFLCLAEYCRSIVATGFPWNTISYAVYFHPLVMQSASVIGIYGMTAFAVLVYALPSVIFSHSSGTVNKRALVAVFGLVLISAHVGFGVARYSLRETGNVEEVTLRLVQPAIDQAEKFNREKESELFQRYLDLSVSEGKNGQKLSDVTHLIWPESAFPFLLTERRDALSAIGAMLPPGVSLITGAARAEQATISGPESLVFNSIYVINDEGIIVSAADKVHLVPFGEYLPFQETLEALGIEQLTKMQGGFEPGSARKLLETGIGPSFLPLICYEIIFSGSIWGDGEKPGWILNLTNDAWFGYTPGPFQHLRQAVLRGVEEGVPVVRVANSGISGIFTAYGETQESLALSQMGIVDGNLPIAVPGETIFRQYGNTIFWAVFLIFFVVGVSPVQRKD